MFDRRWRKVARDLWLHRARSVMVVLAMVVGLVGAGAVLDTWALVDRATREGYLATNPASATLRLAPGDSVDATLLQAVRGLPFVAEAEARRTALARVRVGSASLTALLFAGRAPEARRIGRISHERGTWPPGDGTFVIENSSVEFAGASIGDSIEVRIGDAPARSLPVIGIARDPGLAPGWMDHIVYGFITPATLVRLGASPGLDELQIVVSDRSLDRTQVRARALEVRDVARRLGHQVAAIDVPEPGEHVHAAQMSSLLLTKGAFGVLALLLSAFLVVNLVTAMLAGQLREIGVMKAIGARPMQLAGMYLGLALVLGIVASAIAVPVAAMIGREYARFAAGLLNFSVDGFAIPRAAIVVQLATGVLLPVLAAAIPVWRGSRIPAAVALRDVGIAAAGATPRWLENVRGVRRPLLLSLRNAFRRRARVTLTLVTLSLGGAVFLAALDLRSAIRSSVSHLYETLMRFDMTVRLEEPQPVARAEEIARSVTGAATVEAWTVARAAMTGDEALGGSFAVTALPAKSRLVRLPVEAGRWLDGADRGAMVVSKRLLEEDPALAPGSEIALVIRGRASRWRVVGMVNAGPTPMAYVTREAFAIVAGDSLATTIAVRAAARDIDAQSAVALRMRAAFEDAGLPVASSQLLAESRRVVEDHLLMVVSFLLVMAQLVVVVGGLGLASTMSLAVIERTREIGVMRAIGAGPSAIRRLMQSEGLVIALCSWLVAIPLSIPASVALARMFGRIMFPVPPSPAPDGRAVVIWLAVAVIVSLLSCAWPAWRATRVSTASALAYE